MHWKGYYGRLTAATVSAETRSRLLKASRWAGNVGELAKQRSPISSPLFSAFTLLPYYRVYRSAFTPLGHPPHPPPPHLTPLEPPSRTLWASMRCERKGGKWGEAKANSAKRRAVQRAGCSGGRAAAACLRREGGSGEGLRLR